MPIRPFLHDASFDPETVELLGRALETAAARFNGTTLPGTRRAIAILIVNAAKGGAHDLDRLVAAGLGSEECLGRAPGAIYNSRWTIP